MSDLQKMNEITNGLVSDLPEGWLWCRMDEIAKINPRHPLNVLPENIEASFLPMPNLNEDSWKIKENQTRPLGEIRKGYTHFAEDDVLFAKITPCMENGKAAIARNLVNRIGCGTTELHVIRPHGGIPPEFVYHYIHQESFRQEAEACMTGTAGQLRVPVDFVASAIFPIPPTQEQILIVNRIELLLERTRKAKESLEKIPRIMKSFRQAALKKAFSGEFTAEWRAQQKDLEPAAELLRRIREERKHLYTEEVKRAKDEGRKLPKKPIFSETEPLKTPELPEEWVWSSLNELADTQPGFACGNKSVQDGLMHLRMNNISDECHLNMDLIRKVPLDFKIEKYLLKKGDLLFCHTNSSKLVGKNTIFNIDGDYAYSNHLTRIRVDSNIIFSNWLWCILTIYWKEGRFEKDCKNWVNQSTLPNDKIIQLSIPLPPLLEQQEIVRRIEALFKFADETEKNAAEAKKRVEIMTQSILARAFRGDLSADFREAVRNWKDLDAEARGRYVFVLPEEEREKVLEADEFPMEPASRLLERIRNERTRNERGTKSTRIKGRKQKEEVSPDVEFKDENFIDSEGKV